MHFKNQIMKDKYKINEIIGGTVNSEFSKIEKNSFNQIIDLQLLIQKHSGLKELCK